MLFDPISLPWLPGPPEDFRKQCRVIQAADAGLGMKVQMLASHRLDAAQSASLGKAIARVRANGGDLHPLAPFRLAILASTTFNFIADALPAAAARHSLALEVLLPSSDQVEQQAFDPASMTSLGHVDAVLLAVDHRWLGLDRAAINGDADARLADSLGRLRAVIANVVGNARATVIVPTIPVPPLPLFGSYDRRVPGTPRAMIDRFNAALPHLCGEENAVLFDVAVMAESVGTALWFDAAFYNLFKLPFAPDIVPLYCDGLARLLGAMRGKGRKCLVLDLDNTCWGGVIGDDGLEGIRIGAGCPEGESFSAVQRAALDLKERGVILAVSSKNDDANARAPFRDHPDMLLRESDIAVFQANWSDKPSNLEAIAKTLEIGLDSLVFLDDNGAERAQVRAALPMVAVPELPNDAALYPALLYAAGYFEAVSFSAEDRGRSESYAANTQRAKVLSDTRNLGDYLALLEMAITFSPFDRLNRARIAQLINKSNQFNLTTRRYTEAQLADMEDVGAAFTLQTRLTDRFGDFGMIGVIIVKAAQERSLTVWEIDTWLMSCRVLGRRVEEGMLAELVEAARRAGIRAITGYYIPTVKNHMVSDHFDKLGFTRTASRGDQGHDYRLDIATYITPELPYARTARA